MMLNGIFVRQCSVHAGEQTATVTVAEQHCLARSQLKFKELQNLKIHFHIFLDFENKKFCEFGLVALFCALWLFAHLILQYKDQLFATYKSKQRSFMLLIKYKISLCERRVNCKFYHNQDKVKKVRLLALLQNIFAYLIVSKTAQATDVNQQ